MKKHSLAYYAGLVIFSIIGISCSSADQADYMAAFHRHKIEFYSGGVLVRTYYSKGKVYSESNSDGFRFADETTGKLIRLTGDIIITVLD